MFLVRVLVLGSDFQLFKDEYWRAGQASMTNHENGSGTVLHFDDYQFGVGFKPQDFEQASLSRAR